MAGDIKRQRKSWTLQDRSKVSINILRANVAEEGDEDAQLDIAKRLIQESLDPDNSGCGQENARLALYWLIKSSEQGNDEATELLRECLQSGNGLTAQNILDVKTCVSTPKYEKLTFKAARLLHRKLSNGEEFITTAQLIARMKTVAKGSNVVFSRVPNGGAIHDAISEENEETPDEHQNAQTGSKENTGQNNTYTLDQSEDVDLNETFTVPSQIGDKKSPKSTSPHQSPARPCRAQSQLLTEDLPHLDLQYAMIQPGKRLTLSDLLNVAKDFNEGKTPEISVDERSNILSRHTWSILSSPNIFIGQLLMLAVIGNLLQVWNALACGSMLGISWSCYNCLIWKLRKQNFEDWKSAFKTVLQGDWDTTKLETRQAISYKLPHLIAFSLAGILLPSLQQDYFPLLHASFGIAVIISIQCGLRESIFPSLQHILVLSTALLYYQSPFVIQLAGESIKEQMSFLHQPMFQTGGHDQTKLIVVDTFTVFVGLIVISTFFKSSSFKIISETLPDVVLSLWLVKTIKVSVSALERDDFVCSLCVALVFCGFMFILSSHLETWKLLLILSSFIVLITAGLAVVTHLGAGNDGAVERMEDQDRFIEWEDYEALCHRKAWSFQTPAATQIKCSTLYGDQSNSPLVKWKGRISIVKVEKLSRSLLDTKNLADVVFDISVGIFPSPKDDGSRNWQNFLSGSSDSAEGSVAPASVIVATNSIPDMKEKQDLIDHVLNLRTGDRIEFVGKLKEATAGSLKPQIVNVQSIKCISCTTADYGEFVIEHEEQEATMESLSLSKRALVKAHSVLKTYGWYENLGSLLTTLS